jgi:hypothetical protein
MKRSVCVLVAVAALLGAACSKDDKKAGGGDEKGEKEEKGEAKEQTSAAAFMKPPETAEVVEKGAEAIAGIKEGEVSEAVKDVDKGKDVKAEDVKREEVKPVKGFGGGEATGFVVVYADKLTVDVHQRFQDILKQIGVYETLAKGLNATLKLPVTIPIQLTECNTVNAFWDPNRKELLMCYELMAYFMETFKPLAKSEAELGEMILSATLNVFLHELGHGLIDVFELPVATAEEQAADSLAALMMIMDSKEATKMAMTGAYYFKIQAEKSSEAPLFDEHPPDAARYYNILCWIYGSDPDAYGELVSSGSLPQARAERCSGPGGEWEKLKKSWDKMLAPYLQTQAAQKVEMASAPPAPPPPPPPSEPSQPSLTCEQVVDHGIQLYLAQLEAEVVAQKATPEQIQELKTQLETQVPQMRQQAVDECNQKNWPAQARECVMKATEAKGLESCGI